MNTTVPAPPEHGPHLKLALLLGAVGGLAALALLPYLMTLLPVAPMRMPLWRLALEQTLASGVLCWLSAWLGLFLGAPHGLDAPWLRAWLYRQPWPARVRPHWALAASLGVLAGLAVAGLSIVGTHAAPSSQATSAAGWAWRGALASFYGGIDEEILCRLLLVSLLVWLLAKLRHGQARTWIFVTAIVLAALLFGAGHLPAASAAHLLHGAGAIARLVLLNALVGVVCGAIFWRWGLEHAMLAHFAADLVLHVGLPLLQG